MWLSLVISALLALAGALLIIPWSPWRGGDRSDTGGLALPNAPAPQEEALLDRVVSAKSGNPTAARLLGDYYRDAARPFAALWAYADALRAQPDDMAATLGMARALEQAGFLDAAVERLRPVVAREPGQPEAVARLAELYLGTGRPEAALAVVRGAGAAFTGSKDGAVLEGRVRQALGDGPGAKAAYWRAVGMEANDAEVRLRIGRLALSRGEIFPAQQAFGAARIIAPQNPLYEVEFGRAHAASPQREEQQRAYRYFTAAMKLSPRFALAYYEAGIWYSRQARWPEAVERLQMAVACDPEYADAHEALARAIEAAGRRAEAHRHRGRAAEARDLAGVALREYQAWAALEPENLEAEIQVAQSYFNTNHGAAARARLEKARRRFPRDAAVRERLIAYYLLGLDRAPARRLCEEWLREELRSAQALGLLGRVAAAEQQTGEAIRLYEQALAQEPDNLHWRGTLGETLLMLPGTDTVSRAVAALARAATGDPDEPRWRLALAQGLQRFGRTADARRQALRALDLDSNQSRAYHLVVQCARREGAAGPLALFADLTRTAEARLREEQPLWQATWERPRDAGAYAALAGFLIRTGNLAAAEGQLAEAQRLRPDWPEVRAQLGRVRRLQEVF